MGMFWFICGLIIGFIVCYKLVKGKVQVEKNNRKRLAGKYAEKFVPFLDNIDYNPADMYFLGMPIDYVVFDGHSEGYVDKVVFLEVKSGGSQLSQREKLLKDAITNKRIEWREIRI